ncbi:MAG: YdcF family protein [Bacteroidales bacterium]|nr:YdcF family protein [Bacteroidales bacterium]
MFSILKRLKPNIKKWTKRRKIVCFSVLTLFVLAIGFTVVANVLVNNYSSGRCYDDAEAIPHNRVGLLLGTSPKTKQGTVNLYFKYRMEAAAELYHSGKIDKILISGDNRHKNYNEPAAMRNALLELGVPDSAIVLDYAGFRTYDSMVRAKKVFGQDRLTVISQSWHNERALYIAHRVGIEAIGYNARDVAFRKVALKNHIREWFARAKMVFDLIFQHDPHFLGDPIEI